LKKTKYRDAPIKYCENMLCDTEYRYDTKTKKNYRAITYLPYET